MELNIYGDFKQGPWKTSTEILSAINSGRAEWYPGKVELRQFAASGAGLVEGAVNVWNVLCAIVRHKPRRVSIFTHGTEGYIGLSGWVVKGNVVFDSAKEENALSPELISEAEDEGFYFSDLKTKNATIKNVRDALPKHAEMILYACHSGSDQDYLKRIASLLQIKVKGFKMDIRYHPVPSQDRKTIAWKYSAGDSEKVTDFHELQPDVFADP